MGHIQRHERHEDALRLQTVVEQQFDLSQLHNQRFVPGKVKYPAVVNGRMDMVGEHPRGLNK